VITEYNYNKVISFLSDLISADPHLDTSYKNVIRIAKNTNQHYVKCCLSDYKYLYGTFINQAKIISQDSLITSPS